MSPFLRTVAPVIVLSSISPAASGQTTSPQPVEIKLTDFRFTPDALQLRQGQPYRLRFVNAGSGGHNFAAPEFFAAAQIDPADAPMVAKGKVEIDKGQTREIRLTPAAGTDKGKCTHFMHSAVGMKGRIAVD